MKVEKETIEKLALEWLAEAKRLQSNVHCGCGCGEKISVTRFRPGHDAKLLSQYRRKIKGVLAESE